MVEGGRGPAFPVVFFDGEREQDIGNVKINPTLQYKPFQLMISQKIGVSQNQISIYLLDRSKSRKSDDRRREPITAKVDFGSICRRRDCCIYVVLKRSRKSRNRREQRMGFYGGVEFADYLPDSEFFPPPPPPPPLFPENMILLRRNQPFYDQITQTELADLNERLQSLRIQRENFQMAMNSDHRGLNPGLSPASLIADHRGVNASSMMTTNKKAACEECEKGTASFHHCVNDVVISSRFPTRLGPINRPINKPF